MVNEAVLIFETEMPLPFTCSNTVGIEKGTLLTLSDPLTVAACTTSTAAVGGIAAEEKIASDGKTKIAVYRGGIFKVTCSGAATVGLGLVFENSNTLCNQAAAAVHSAGVALETAAAGETFLFELRPSHRVIA